MSVIKLDSVGYSEQELGKNWAAQYTRRMIDTLGAKLDNDIAGLSSDIETLDAKHTADIEGLETDIEAMAAQHSRDVSEINSEISIIESRQNAEHSEFASQLDTAGTAIDVFQNYSTTPRQVGTWVDGTPIWRVAIVNRKIVYNPERPSMYNLQYFIPFYDYENGTNNVYYVTQSSSGSVWILSCHVSFGTPSNGITMYSGNLLTDTKIGIPSYVIEDMGTDEHPDVIVRGWIDFVADESIVRK